MANTLTQLAVDTFVRANENPLSGGGTWTANTTSGIIVPAQLVSNAVESTVNNATDHACGWYTGISWPNDQYCDVTLGALVLNSDFVGPMVRATSGVDTRYFLAIGGPVGPTAIAYLIKKISGAQTILVGPNTITATLGDVFRIAVIGTTLSAFQNGSAISGMSAVTDSGISSGNAGIFVSAGSIVQATVTHFDGGSVYAGTVSSVGLSPSTVTYPSNSTGTVTLSANAPTGGIVVTLTSGTTATATVPASVTVLAGASTATFTVTSQNVVSQGTSLITGAIGGGSSANATITVNPTGGGGGGNAGSLMMTGCGAT